MLRGKITNSRHIFEARTTTGESAAVRFPLTLRAGINGTPGQYSSIFGRVRQGRERLPMRCLQCGTENEETNTVCASCGAALRAQPAAVAPSAQPPPAPVDLPTLSSLSPISEPRGVPPSPDSAEALIQSVPAASPAPPAESAPPPAATPAAAGPYSGSSPLPGWPAPIAGTPHAPPGARAALPQFGSLAGGPPQYSMLCGVCGVAILPGKRRCVQCSTPQGAIINPNDPTATSFLPFGPPVPLVPLFRTSDPAAKDPDEKIRGWNWAATLVPTLWAIRHRRTGQALGSGLLTLLLVALYLLRAGLHRTPDASGTLAGLLGACALIFAVPRSIFAGLRGSEVAWNSGIYQDRDQLLKARRSWTLCAIIGVIVVALLLGTAAAILNAQ